MLRQTAGQKVDPRLFRSLSVHLLRIHIEVLSDRSQQVAVFSKHKLIQAKHWLWGHADLREVGDMSLTEGHIFRLLHDVSVNDEHVGELGSKAQLDLSATVKFEAHALRKFWDAKKKYKLNNAHLVLVLFWGL